MKTYRLFLFAVSMAFAGGCASSGSVGDLAGLIDETLGTADYNTLVSETPNALTTRFGYRILRAVTEREDVRFETDWKVETALPDERKEGYTHTRIRIFISARPRNRSTSMAASYSVDFEAYVERQALGLDVWEQLPLTAQRREEIDRIVDFLEQTYRNALR